MDADLGRLVAALAGSKGPEAGAPQSAAGPLITISRGYGAGGHSVGQIVAQALHLNVYDRDLFDALAQGSGIDPSMIQRLDEKVRGSIEEWIHSLIAPKTISHAAYRKHLVNAVTAIRAGGGVIIGRGCNCLVRGRNALRVRLVAPMSVAARRVSEREGIPLKEAEKAVVLHNHERAQWVDQMFHVGIDDPTQYDLVINTERVGFQSAAELVIAASKAMRASG